MKANADYIVKNAKFIGYSHNGKVFKHEKRNNISFYLDDGGPQAFASFSKRTNPKELTFNLIYTPSGTRSKGFMFQLLFFIKDTLQYKMFGSGYMTKLGVEFFKKLDRTKMFDVKWFNNNTEEKVPFSEIEGKFTKHIEKNGWVVMVEAAKDPMFPDAREDKWMPSIWVVFNEDGSSNFSDEQERLEMAEDLKDYEIGQIVL